MENQYPHSPLLDWFIRREMSSQLPETLMRLGDLRVLKTFEQAWQARNFKGI
jgi:hypothetical protein